MSELAMIVGAGPGLSASLARTCASEGMRVVLAARNIAKLTALAQQTEASVYACDAGRREDVDALFDAVLDNDGTPDLVVFNPSARVRGAVADLDPEAVEQAIRISAFAGFLVARRAAMAMRERGSGTIQFTGASASVKGYPESACFAMGKFALRGLAQSMARELAPRGIHVAHFVIDGGIKSGARVPDNDEWLDPDAIAATYLHVHRQHRSAWTWEIELRPWVEHF